MRTAIFAALTFFALSAQAATTTWIIDFEDLGVAAGSALHPPDNTVITSGGFDFVNGPASDSNADLHIYNQYSLSLGNSTEMASHGDLIAMQSSSGVFSLLSFDIGSSFSEAFSSVQVVGHYLGGGTITQNITLDGNTSTYESIALGAGFENLISVNWLASGGTQSLFMVDNIAVSAVPVPAAVWLFGSGVGLLGWMKRRRNS